MNHFGKFLEGTDLEYKPPAESPSPTRQYLSSRTISQADVQRLRREGREKEVVYYESLGKVASSA
jgi:hypothetical protein